MSNFTPKIGYFQKLITSGFGLSQGRSGSETHIIILAEAADDDHTAKREIPNKNYIEYYLHTKDKLSLPRPYYDFKLTPLDNHGEGKDDKGRVTKTEGLKRAWRLQITYDIPIDTDTLRKNWNEKRVLVGTYGTRHAWYFTLRLDGIFGSEQKMKWKIYGTSVQWVDDIDAEGFSQTLTSIVRNELKLPIIGKVRRQRSNDPLARGMMTKDFTFQTRMMITSSDETADAKPTRRKHKVMRDGWDEPRIMVYFHVIPPKRCGNCDGIGHEEDDCDFVPIDINEETDYESYARPIAAASQKDVQEVRSAMTKKYEMSVRNTELTKIRKMTSSNLFAIRDASNGIAEMGVLKGVKQGNVLKSADIDNLRANSGIIEESVKNLMKIIGIEGQQGEILENLYKEQVAKASGENEKAAQIAEETKKKVDALEAGKKRDKMKIFNCENDEIFIKWDYPKLEEIFAPQPKYKKSTCAKIRDFGMYSVELLKEQGMHDAKVIAVALAGHPARVLARHINRELLEHIHTQILQITPDAGRDQYDPASGIVNGDMLMAIEIVVHLLVENYKEGNAETSRFDFEGVEKYPSSEPK